MPQQKTHREVKKPQISARYLADYMAASEQARRTIVRSCKYQPTARVVQHEEARMTVGKYLRGRSDINTLNADAKALRDRLADTDFDRALYDHNADYITRFAKVSPKLKLPEAEVLAPGQFQPVSLHGVRINVDIAFRLRRITRTNKVRVGAGMLRYAKGKRLPKAVGEWQSAFLLGYLNAIGVEDGADAEHQLCITIDAFLGVAYGAPTDAVRRYNNMAAACASIAERWDNIQPPPGAIF